VNAALSDEDRTTLTRPFAEQHFVARDLPKHGGSTKPVACRHPDRQASPVPATDGQRAPSSGRSPPWTCLTRTWSREAATQFSHRPDRGELRLRSAASMPCQPHFAVGVVGTTGKMVVSGAPPAPSTRLTEHEATPAAFSATSVRAARWLRTKPQRAVCLPPELPLPRSQISQGTPITHLVSTIDYWRARTRIGLVVLWTAMGIVQMHRELTPMIERHVAQSCTVSVARLCPAWRFALP
jgi:hypothetical protein